VTYIENSKNQKKVILPIITSHGQVGLIFSASSGPLSFPSLSDLFQVGLAGGQQSGAK